MGTSDTERQESPVGRRIDYTSVETAVVSLLVAEVPSMPTLPNVSSPDVSERETPAHEELFDVVDEHDHVLRQAPRSQVHREHWLHRAVHIFVFNCRGELLVHQRSATKDEQPLKWNSSASGHLHAGEGYDAAAARELEEELGYVLPLEFLVKLPACAELSYEHTGLYRCATDAVPICLPEEIAAWEYRPLDRIVREIAASTDVFSPPFRVLFDWYVRHASLR